MHGSILMTCWVGIAALATTELVYAGTEAVATNSATVMSAGPRSGDNGKVYFNIQGKANQRYASFGVLEFPLGTPAPKAGKATKLTLTLVQSIPSFAKNGNVKLYLVDESKKASAEASGLKFDVSVPDGLGEQVGARHLLGPGEFKKIETGHVDTFSIALDEKLGELVRAELVRGGRVRLAIVPDGDGVAATYFGSGAREVKQRPKLVIETAP